MSTMRPAEDLRRTLQRIDRRGYKAYKDIQGRYRFNRYEVSVDHVQGDPFADPSRVRIFVPPATAEFPSSLFETPSRRIDFRVSDFFFGVQNLSLQNR